MSPANKTVIETRGELEIVIRRSFDAPAELVFDAWTRPELVRSWWVPEAHGVEGVRFDADVRAGGTYRYVLRAPAESSGEAAGAGLPEHVHVHVLPRWQGDTNFMTAVASTRVLPEPLETSWRKLRDAWPQSSSS